MLKWSLNICAILLVLSQIRTCYLLLRPTYLVNLLTGVSGVNPLPVYILYVSPASYSFMPIYDYTVYTGLGLVGFGLGPTKTWLVPVSLFYSFINILRKLHHLRLRANSMQCAASRLPLASVFTHYRIISYSFSYQTFVSGYNVTKKVIFYRQTSPVECWLNSVNSLQPNNVFLSVNLLWLVTHYAQKNSLHSGGYRYHTVPYLECAKAALSGGPGSLVNESHVVQGQSRGRGSA